MIDELRLMLLTQQWKMMTDDWWIIGIANATNDKLRLMTDELLLNIWKFEFVLTLH